MISLGMSSCEHTINTLRYADRFVRMIGLGDGGGGVLVVLFRDKTPVLVPLRLFRLKRCTAGSFAVSFRALNRNNMTGN